MRSRPWRERRRARRDQLNPAQWAGLFRQPRLRRRLAINRDRPYVQRAGKCVSDVRLRGLRAMWSSRRLQHDICRSSPRYDRLVRPSPATAACRQPRSAYIQSAGKRFGRLTRGLRAMWSSRRLQHDICPQVGPSLRAGFIFFWPTGIARRGTNCELVVGSGAPYISAPGGAEERVGPGKSEGLSVLPPTRRISYAVRSHVFLLPSYACRMTARASPPSRTIRFDQAASATGGPASPDTCLIAAGCRPSNNSMRPDTALSTRLATNRKRPYIQAAGKCVSDVRLRGLRAMWSSRHLQQILSDICAWSPRRASRAQFALLRYRKCARPCASNSRWPPARAS